MQIEDASLSLSSRKQATGACGISAIPPLAERRRHRLTHLPYRHWLSRGRGRDLPPCLVPVLQLALVEPLTPEGRCNALKVVLVLTGPDAHRTLLRVQAISQQQKPTLHDRWH